VVRGRERRRVQRVDDMKSEQANEFALRQRVEIWIDAKWLPGRIVKLSPGRTTVHVAVPGWSGCWAEQSRSRIRALPECVNDAPPRALRRGAP
jgi:hypothetical protein